MRGQPITSLGIILVLCATALARGGVLPNPTITAATASSSPTNAVAGIFDNLAEASEYRTNAAGNTTFIEFDFGTQVTIDGFLNVTRSSTSSVVTGSRLIFDNDGSAGFSAATDSVVEFNAANTGSTGQGYLNRFAPVTARRVRWEVTANAGSSQSCGAMEMRFLGAAAGTTPVAGVGVTAGSPALDAYHALANASNGLAGRTLPTYPYSDILPAVGYASNAGATATFVDFDLGQTKLVAGFDFFDQLGTDQRVNSFTLSFSNDAGFVAPVATRSYSNSGFSLSDAFAAIPARYIRYQVTSCAAANPGLSELVFYETAGSSLATAFSPGANPSQNWLHGEKATPLAKDLTAYQTAAPPDTTAPCQRWGTDPAAQSTAFIGTAPLAAASFLWGGTATDWSAGALYHAWRNGHALPMVSRFTIIQSGWYDIAAGWQAHTVAGCEAIVSIVANGSTVYSANLSGFAGTPHGTTAPSGAAPIINGAASGIPLAAGATVDIVTLPLSAVGNVAVDAHITAVAAPAETTASVVIREFCAANLNGLRDEDGAASDWIELYNGTGTAVDLTNWSLTDRSGQPRMWLFPPRILPHGQRLVVFASNKDSVKRAAYGPTSQLHTNFALAKSGEFLGLADPDGGFVSSFAPTFPAQYDDITYGLGANGLTGYQQPTPGAANAAASPEPLTVLAFSAPSGLFSSTLSVTISGYSASHTVRYTTDGTEPTLATGLTYTGTPIRIAASTTLRARTYAASVAGPLAQATYSKLGTASQYGITPATFTSALPVLVIDAPAAPPSDKTPLVARFTLIERNPADGLARLSGTPALATRGTIKLRGQWSSSFPKQGYAIEFWDGSDQDEARQVCGMPAESDWTLYAAYQTDPDFMRNVLVYELFRRMGRWAPRTRFVEVFLNTGAAQVDGASYYGVYVLREKIKIDADRVDISQMTAADSAGEAVSGGYIIAHDKYGNGEQTHPELLTGNRDGFPHWLPNGAFVYKTPSVTDITAAQKAYISDYVLQTDAAIAPPTFTHPVTGRHYTDYIARDSFIDHHMLMAFAKNLDGLRISTYFTKDRGGKLKMSVPWDNDLSQCPADAGSAGADPNNWNSDMDASANYSDYFTRDAHIAEGWFHYLHQDPGYMQEWVDRFDRWRNSGVLDPTQISTFLNQAAAELTAADNNGTAAANTPIARNFGRWPRATNGISTQGTNAAAVIFGSATTSEISRHKTWLQQRIAFMDTWVLRKPVPSRAAGVVSPGATLSLTSPDLTGAARFYYTLDGTDPRAETGGIAPTALPWSGSLALGSSTLLKARLYQPSPVNKHTAWSAPLEARYIVGAVAAAAANLVVSELMYHPADPSAREIAAGITDAEAFEYIELRNTSATPVNLWGARFSAGLDFDFNDITDPARAQLAPGQTLLLVADAAAFTLRYGNLAACRIAGSFAAASHLANSGETLTILDANGLILLDFTYTDNAPWPAAADGGSAGLHLIGGSAADPRNWFAFAPDPGQIIADHDGDGQDDSYEWLAGTDPTSAASFFHPTIAAMPAAAGFTLTFPVAAGHRYRIERSADCLQWQPLATGITATQSGTATINDAAPHPACGFYRVAASFAP